MNRVSLIGRTVKDIELRKTTTGKSTCSFVLAVPRDKDTADFIQCVAWNQRAELMARYVHKGNKIGISGKIQTRKYGNRDGQTVYVTEILVDEVEFLEKKEIAPEPQKEPTESVPEHDDYSDLDDIDADALPF
jgi:single-strand DNA-binding protein